MSRNGSGTYNLPAGNPVVTGTTISSTWANTTLSDIANALTQSVASDGQTPMSANLNMATNKVVNVADPSNAQDAATKNYVDTTASTNLGLSLLKANNLSDVASASTSRTNLGLAIGTDVQAYNANTVFLNVATNFTAQQYFGNVALTDASTISWAANTAQVATFTFVSSNRTMGAPSGLVNGAYYGLAVIQNGGSNTLTWNSVFKWTGGTAPTLSTAAGAKDYFVFRSDGTNLYEQGRSLGVS